MIILFPECLVRNKTIIGLKFSEQANNFQKRVRNKTIIGLKWIH